MFFESSSRSVADDAPTVADPLGEVRAGGGGGVARADLAQRRRVGPERRGERAGALAARPARARQSRNAWTQCSVWNPAGAAVSEAKISSATASGSIASSLGEPNGVWVKCVTATSGRSSARYAGDEEQLQVLDQHDVALGRRSRPRPRRTPG